MFHVLSLQRTASKSLVSTLSSLLDPKNTVLLAGEPLAEFLHYWSLHDFRFAGQLTKPFGHEEDVVFYKTHPCFNHPTNIQFEYVQTGDQATGYAFDYSPVPVGPERPRLESFLQCLELLRRVNPSHSQFVLKTQLAHLLHQLTGVYRNVVLDSLANFHDENQITTVKLSRKSGLDWLCSMALTDASGIFIPCRAQSLALENFVQNPFPVSPGKVDAWVSMWNKHETTISADNTFFDTDLSKPQVLRTRRGPKFVTIPASTKPLEFSSVDYSKTIANYGYLRHVAKTRMIRGDE